MKQNWKTIFIIHISDKELVIRIHKELLQFNNTNNPIFKNGRHFTKKKTMNDQQSPERMFNINGNWRKAKQNQNEMHYTPTRMAKI